MTDEVDVFIYILFVEVGNMSITTLSSESMGQHRHYNFFAATR